MSKVLLDNTKIPYSEINKDYNGILWRFKGISHILNFVDYRYKNNIRYAEYRSSTRSKDDSFHSHNTLEEAIEEATKKKLLPEKVRKLILTESKTSYMNIVDSGGVVSIPAFLSNQPEHFETFSSRSRVKLSKKKAEKIFISCSVLCGVTPEQYEEYLLNCIIDAYTNYRNPEVILCFVSTEINGDDEVFELYIEIPPYEMNSIMRMSFTDFYRRIIFFIREQYPELDSGYGRAIEGYQLESKHKYYTYYN